MDIVSNQCSPLSISRAEIEQVEQEKQEFKLLGTYLKTPGLSLFCFNPHKDKIEEVEVIKPKTCILIPMENGSLLPQPYEREKIVVDPTWEYFEALNKKSAQERVRKWKLGKIKFLWNLRLPGKLSDIKPF